MVCAPTPSVRVTLRCSSSDTGSRVNVNHFSSHRFPSNSESLLRIRSVATAMATVTPVLLLNLHFFFLVVAASAGFDCTPFPESSPTGRVTTCTRSKANSHKCCVLTPSAAPAVDQGGAVRIQHRQLFVGFFLLFAMARVFKAKAPEVISA